MSIPIHGISHITFSVSDLDASIAFYQGVFDATLVLRTTRMAYFDINGLWLALNAQTDIPRQEIAYSYTHIAFSLEAADFKEMENRLKYFGVPLRPGRYRNEGEGQSLYFTDPDGHLLEFHTGNLNTRVLSYAKFEGTQ